MTSEEETQDFEALLKLIKQSRGFDFSGYKRTTLDRRIRRRMSDVGIASFSEYADRCSPSLTSFSSFSTRS